MIPGGGGAMCGGQGQLGTFAAQVEITIYTGLLNTCKPDSSGNIVPGNCDFSTASKTLYQINPNLHSPYTMQAAVSIERQLGSVGTVSFTYLNTQIGRAH